MGLSHIQPVRRTIEVKTSGSAIRRIRQATGGTRVRSGRGRLRAHA